MYDIITLGSASLDVFVKTKEELVKHEGHEDLCYHLGDKILIDNLRFSTGGGGTNTAVAFSRLGLKTAFLGCLGNDSSANQILEELSRERVEFIGKKVNVNSGYSVILAGKKDRSILSFKGANNFLKLTDKEISSISAKWLYVSTMLKDSKETSFKVIKIMKSKGTKVALNLSTYLAKEGWMKLKPIISQTDVLILNLHEAELLTNIYKREEILSFMKKNYSGTLVITNGDKESLALQKEKVFIKKIKPVKIVDKTGAGDAFASGFVYGLIKNAPIQKCLDFGHKEALSVLGSIGAKNNLLKKLV